MTAVDIPCIIHWIRPERWVEERVARRMVTGK